MYWWWRLGQVIKATDLWKDVFIYKLVEASNKTFLKCHLKYQNKKCLARFSITRISWIFHLSLWKVNLSQFYHLQFESVPICCLKAVTVYLLDLIVSTRHRLQYSILNNNDSTLQLPTAARLTTEQSDISLSWRVTWACRTRFILRNMSLRLNFMFSTSSDGKWQRERRGSWQVD